MNPLKDHIQQHLESIQTQIAQDYKISKSFKIKCFNHFSSNTQLYNPYINSDSFSYFEQKVLKIRSYILEATKKLTEENPHIFPLCEDKFTCHVQVISNYQFNEEQIEKLKKQNKDYRSGFSALGPSIPHLVQATHKIFQDIIIQSENVIVELDCKRQLSANEPYIAFTFKVKNYDI